jgi:hypothetical protein
MQIALVMQAPIKHRDDNILVAEQFKCGNRDLRRIKPYLPSFSKIAARTIEPANGASTWALGSHRCREYTGIFTKKAMMEINHHMFRSKDLVGSTQIIKFSVIDAFL